MYRGVRESGRGFRKYWLGIDDGVVSTATVEQVTKSDVRAGRCREQYSRLLIQLERRKEGERKSWRCALCLWQDAKNGHRRGRCRTEQRGRCMGVPASWLHPGLFCGIPVWGGMGRCEWGGIVTTSTSTNGCGTNY